MSDTIDLHFLELMASKICHDLISPIGAVNNGVEFLEEMGEDAGKEVTDLIAFSAAQASAKLQAFRMAYGIGGGDSNIKPEDVHTAIERVISQDGKIKQDWDPHANLGFDETPKGYCKTLINTILLAMECLPKGGAIRVEAGAPGQSKVIAVHEDASLKDEVEIAFNHQCTAHDLEPKTTHAYAVNLLAKRYGLTVVCESKDGGAVTFTINA